MVSHKDGWARLGRPTGHRLSLLRNLVTSLIQHERIKTTHTNAKACQRMADRMIELGKSNTHINRSYAKSYLYDKSAIHKLFDSLGPRYTYRNGGYTRVVHAERRINDNAQLSYIELIQNSNELRHTPDVDKSSDEQYHKSSAINHSYQQSIYHYSPEQAPRLGSQHHNDNVQTQQQH